MHYSSVVVTGRGSLDALQVVERDLRPPTAGEARIKVLATPVVQDDIAARRGNRPFLPKLPFTPGYTVLGVVDAVGEAVADVAVGDRVAALTVQGGHAEYLYWDAQQLVRVPEALDPAKAVVLILNYLVAYQALHRVAKVRRGDKVLIVGASGGVGTAFLDLGRVAGLTMYGLASPRKHYVLAQYGATAIDYHTQDVVEVIRRAEPEGLDAVLNGMGEEYIERGLAVLRRGGTLVLYGGPQSFRRFLVLIGKLAFYAALPNGKAIRGYGTHRGDISEFQDDWATLFRLLEAGQIDPIIADRFAILDARAANERMESGQAVGNIVLLAPELL